MWRGGRALALIALLLALGAGVVDAASKTAVIDVQGMVTVDPRNAHAKRESLALMIPILKPPLAAP